MSEQVNHQRIKTNGIWMHVAEQGSGSGRPLVLLIHGFPELWYSWRHQITHLANHGYHVVAPDMRGYGDTDAPLPPNSYTVFHLVGDLIGLLDHFGAQQAFVVGHDWGSIVARCLSLFRPDRVKGLVLLSVPVTPRPQIKYVDLFRHRFGDGFYMCQFQEAGRAEKSFGRYDYVTVMKKFLLIDQTDPLVAPPGMEIIDALPTPSSLPAWIAEEDIKFYADQFQKSGFTGPLNYYRAFDLNWELLAPWDGSKITVRTKFIVGNKDIGFDSGTRAYIEGDEFQKVVPNLEMVILDGHHFIQQEKAQEVSNEILSFLRTFPPEQ
ncbi:uncharacterized protein LOC131146998 [Malania oleifera]|uniref:uncharacterized protein LOC131146998 n=1 Tax=Malania oleifera TaxID=397392 RepID=UPI0025AE9581|nr:uncharacterized protein LOC131146998 [Malania oleifera]XP_057952887.1 uncharacterized protein LOC131146998 [Malania oleifera]